MGDPRGSQGAQGGRPEPLLETALAGLPKRQGKVRDLYDLGDRLLMVATDRISAFDWVLPTGIPDKGRVLTGLSVFWFGRLGIENHLISTDIDEAGLNLTTDQRAQLAGRSMIVEKAEVVPFECVVRGYLSGSAWKEYRQSQTVCAVRLPAGLVESQKLETPIFTPATKAASGHDENVPIDHMAAEIGWRATQALEAISLEIYQVAADHAEDKGLILADTKFEFGNDPETGGLMLIDEVLTPDSSRYWPRATYRPGGPQRSFDKQFVRDWLEQTHWDKSSPPPALPSDVVEKTREKYIQAYESLTEKPFPWA